MPRTHAELEADFLAFHEAHPHIYRLLRDFAVEAKHKGERGSIAALAEKARRWGTPGTCTYCFDNSHRAFYARLLMEREPELAGYFSVRATPHDPDYHARVRRAGQVHHQDREMRAALEAGRLF